MKLINDPSTTPKLNEYVTCEDYIAGEYKKWCSNYGYIDDSSLSLPGFMHWSWWYTDADIMVADLQGVRYDDHYLLTDPAILSLSKSYGVTDTSVEGMAMFFLKHKCGCFCENLPKPKICDFRGIIPKQFLAVAQSLQAQVHSSTTYIRECVFSEFIRAKIAANFIQIASQN